MTENEATTQRALVLLHAALQAEMDPRPTSGILSKAALARIALYTQTIALATPHRASADTDQALTGESSNALQAYAPEVSQIVVERDLALGERDQARTALEAIAKALDVETAGVGEAFGLAAVVDATAAAHATTERLTTLVSVLTAMLRDRAAPEIRETTTRKNLLADLDIELRNAGIPAP